MSALADVWRFTRARLDQAYLDLNDAQLRWRPFEGAHSAYELLYHIAGAEHYWSSRLMGQDPAATQLERKLDCAILDGFLRDGVCPFDNADLNLERVTETLAFTRSRIEPLLDNATPEQLAMPLISPIGDRVNGYEGLCRLAQHGGYHTGQLWLYRMDPRFPASET